MLLRCFVIAAAALGLLSCAEPVRQVELKRAYSIDDHSSVKPVAITKIVAKIRRGTDIGVHQFGIFCEALGRVRWRSGGRVNLSSEELVDVFREELEINGWPVVGSTDDLFTGYDVSGAELLIAGKISDIESQICQPSIYDDGYTGSMRIKVDWQIYNPARREIIGEISTEGSSIIEETTPAGDYELMNLSFAASVNNLLASKRFLDMVQKNSLASTPSPSEDFTLDNDLTIFGSVAEALERAERGTVVIRTAQSYGSGFAIGDGEHVITNAHVIGEAENVTFVTRDGIEVKGSLLAADKGRDVALLQVQGVRIPPLHISVSDLEMAETVYAIGAPFEESLSGTITEGIISSIRMSDGYSWIQSDAAINPGNSGGPLLNNQGSVIGISTAYYSSSDSQAGVNLFVPIIDALDFLGVNLKGTSIN